jgi:hypothetical protein
VSAVADFVFEAVSGAFFAATFSPVLVADVLSD